MKIHAPFRHLGLGALLLGLFLAVAAQGAEETRDYQTLMAEWVPNWNKPGFKLVELQRLTLEQRRDLAVAAARELSPCTADGELITEARLKMAGNWKTYTTKAARPISVQNRRNSDCMGMIYYLVREGEVCDARMIPPIISLLEYPDSLIISHAIECLHRLTGRQTEDVGRGPDMVPTMRCQNAEWWREWWRNNQDRHPALDPSFQQQLGTRLDRMVDNLVKDLGDHMEFHRLKHDKYPSLYRFANSELESSGSTLPLLIMMETGFGTPAPEAARQYDHSFRYFPQPFDLVRHFENKYGLMVECLREEVPGTDIILTVRASSPDKDYLRRLRESLARLPRMGE